MSTARRSMCLAVPCLLLVVSCGLHTVSVTVSPEGAGTIALSPSGPFFSQGESVTLAATPASGFSFVRYKGGLESTEATASFVVSGPTDIVAAFTDYEGFNSHAVLSGGPIGTGAVSNDSLVKVLPYSRGDLHADLETTVYWVEHYWLVAPVVNRGVEPFRDLDVEWDLYDAAGTRISATSADTYMHGSVCRTDPNYYWSSSLAVGETGYLLGSASEPYAGVASATVVSAATDGLALNPGARVTPVSYTYEVGGATLSVTLRNDGPAAVDLNGTVAAYAFPLDEQDRPLDVFLLKYPDGHRGRLEAGENLTLAAIFASLQGTATRLAVYVAYDVFT